MLSKPVLVCSVLFTGLAAQIQERPFWMGVPSWAKVPVDAAPEPATPQEKAVRDMRAAAFNDTTGYAVKLEEQWRSHMGVGISGEPGPTAVLPTHKSDAIMVGTVTHAQPYMSADHTRIFTELKLSVQQVLKDATSTLTPEGTADVVERGGTLRVDGHVLRYPITGYAGHPDLNYQYVLFLRYDKATRAFGILKSWLLTGETVIPNDPVKPGNEIAAQAVAMGKTQFINFVQQAVAEDKDR